MKNYEHFTKSKIFLFLLIFLVISIGLIFKGCAFSKDAAIFSAKGISYSHNVPETVKLSNYKVIQVNVTSYIKKSDKFCSKLQDKITGMLIKKQLFERVLNREESQEPLADLHLDAEIIALDNVTAIDRMLFDEFVGKAKMVVVNRLKDVKTGKELGTFTTGGQSSSGSGFFAGGTTKQALKYTAKEIVKFIRAHM
jgi:hypothetical protein